MAYLGKEYKFVKAENFDTFGDSLQAVGIPGVLLNQFNDPNLVSKLVKDGDTYTITCAISDKTLSMNFKLGEGADLNYVAGVTLYSEITIDGNAVTQIIKLAKENDKFVTLLREYDGDNMKMTITSNFWDGSSTRYYSV